MVSCLSFLKIYYFQQEVTLLKLSRDLKNVFSALKTRPDSILEVEFDAFNKVKKHDWEIIKSSSNTLAL